MSDTRQPAADADGGDDRNGRLARLTPQQRARFQERLRGGRTASRSAAPARPRRDPDAPVPLSFGQERLWFLEELTPGLAVFNEYVALLLTGPLDTAALRHALSGLVVRHEALRTVVADGPDGPVQRVLADPGFILRETDAEPADGQPAPAGALSDTERALAQEETAQPFDLRRGPLLRALLIRSGPDRAVLVITNHHMVGDAWSRSVLIDELRTGYTAYRDGDRAPAVPGETRYADWAAWQRGELGGDGALEEETAYWRRRLDGAPHLLEVAADRPRPAIPSYRGGRVHFTLDAATTEGVDRLARTARATPFMVTLAAWQAVLARYSGGDDIVVGVPTAGRSGPADLGDLGRVVGMFVNSVVLRSDLSGDPAFADLLGQVRENTLEGLARDRMPFERLVRELRPERDLSYAPLFQVQFGYRNVPGGELGLPGVTMEPVDLDNGVCRGDISLELARDGETTRGVCEFSRDLFDERTAAEWTTVLARVLRRAAEDPARPLSDLLALTEDEHAALDRINTARQPSAGPPPTVVAAFARQAAATPEAPALVSGEDRLDYADLDARAERLATRLRAAGARPGALVGLCLPRESALVVSLLAVLRTGAAYLPLDPAYPAARLDHIVRDAAPAVVVVSAGTRDRAPSGAPLLDLDAPGPAAETAPAVPADDPAPGTAAYVIYTSGSTGTPKGVVVNHGNLAAFLAAMDDVVDAPEPVTWLAVTSVSFDISVLELLWTLSRGHRVVLSPDAAPPRTAPAPRTEGTGLRAPRFSLFYFASDRSNDEPGTDQYRLVTEGARFADTHGFDAVWMPERHFHAFGGPFPAPSVLAAAVARETTRVGLRAGSVVLPLHHPVRVAEEWAVVDNLSRGRVGLSFASGWHVDDFVLAKDAYDDRQQRTVEGIDQVRRLWRGERVAFEGPGGRTVDVGVLPRPVQEELPFWLTSSGSPETCRRAGEIGSGLLTHLLGQSVEELAERIAVYRAAWQSAGHPGTPHVTLMLHAFVGEDPADVADKARQPFRSYLRSSVGLIERMARSLGTDVTAADFTPEDEEALLDHACDRYLRDSALIGTVEDCRPLVERLTAIGVDELACLIDFGVPADDVLAALPRLDLLRREASAAPAAVAPAAPAAGDEPATLARLVRTHGVTHLQCTPSLARTLLDDPDADAFRALRLLLLGGEALDVRLARSLAGRFGATLRNMYGPTETTVWSTTDAVDPDADTVTIGRPIAGTTVHVLDPGLRRTPLGVPGELCIGGAGVTDGYLGRPELTAERFVADPFGDDPRARLYRTGDIVRFRRDGRLEYLSRRDHQVKIRGFRVETGEVEAALEALPAVRQAVVTAYGLGTAQAALAAYLVTDDPAPATADLRAALADRLPTHLIPSRFVLLDELPLTGNGKVDRAALPAPGAADGHRPYTAPATPTEHAIARIWREALQTERVGTDDDFFELGGHSLLATQVIARIRTDLAAELPLRTLFTAPTVAALARAVDAPRPQAGPRPAAHRPIDLRPDPGHRHDPFPLTDVQRAYWIGRSDAVGGDVSCHLYVELDVADVDLRRLQDAWRALVRRHDALRLVIDEHGTQRVLPSVPDYTVAADDTRELAPEAREALLADTRSRMSHQVLPCDVWPLFELRATRTGGRQARLHLSIDTLIADGASVQLLLRELLAVYQGVLDPVPLELSFRDYVLADRARREGPEYDRALRYWLDRLDTLAPAPPLPLRRRPETLERTRFARREAHLPAAEWSRLKSRAAAAGITPSALALTAYAQILGTWSGSDRLTLNLTLFNRDGDHPDLPALVGDFTALTLFEVEGAHLGAFVERARGVQQRLWDDLDHRLVSGVRVTGELARRRGVAEAAMPVVFTSELGAGEVGGTALLNELGARVAHTITQTPQVWLDHQIAEDDGRLRLTWDAVEELFPDGLLDDMFAAYTALLRTLADGDAAWTRQDADVLPARQHQAWRELNDTAAPLPAGLLHEPFLAHAAAHPDRPAVLSGTGNVGYGELERASAAIARSVRAAGAGPGDVVGVLVDRGWEQAAAVLGVLRAGAAYLPLDTRLPATRVHKALDHADAVAVVVLTDATEGRIPARTATVPFDPHFAGEPLPSDLGVAPGDLAYVIYTSGSTGEPKGVMIDHRGARNTVDDINERFGVRADDRVFGLSAIGFDLSVYDVFGTLAAGAALVLPDAGDDRDPQRWCHAVEEHGVTVWNSVPALMEMLLAHAVGNGRAVVESLRLVMLSGDWIPVGMPDQVRAVAPKAQVVSLGGATEASIWSVLHLVDHVDPDRASVPYGRPMRNQTMHVLDERLRPCPLWVPGALHIGGVGLALGYRNAPGLTANAFPTRPADGERLYRTGDLARLLPDGTLEFLGREDSQVKVRGMRIELGEIEAALVRTDGVREAAALVTGRGTAAQLMACVVRDGGPARRTADSPAERPAADERRMRYLDLRLRQPGRRTDLAGHEVVPLSRPADAAVLRGAAAGWSAAPAFATGPVEASALHSLLNVLARQDDGDVPKYAYGSAGALYPVQVYLHVAPGGVAGMAPGTYYLDPAAAALVRLRDDVEHRPELYGESNTELARTAGFGIFLVSRPAAIEPVYGALTDRFCLLEAGAMAQLLRQRAAGTAVALCPVGDVFAGPLAEALLLEDGQQVLHSLLGGRPASAGRPAGDAGEDLRAALAALLPAYMVPQRVHSVDRLPLSANGKVDRKELARLLAGDPEPFGAVPPAEPARPASVPVAAGTTVQRLAALWREVMEGVEPGLDTNFFEMGANSIHLVRTRRMITESFGRELSIVEMFDHPTIRRLAELLDAPDTGRAFEGAAGPADTAGGAPGRDRGAQQRGRQQHRERRRATRRATGDEGTAG